jgi:hypothetical protein
MKKLTATLVSLIVLSMASLPVAAQTRGRYVNSSNADSQASRRYDNRAERIRAARTRNNTVRTNAYGGVVYDNNTYNSAAYNNDVYGNDVYAYGDNRSVWERHRDKITTAGGAVGGALLGGVIGGKKGAVIGAITGGAGAAIYTYKVRDRIRNY